MVASEANVRKPPAIVLDQWWRPLHKTGYSWMAKGNVILVHVIRDIRFGGGGSTLRECAPRAACSSPVERPRIQRVRTSSDGRTPLRNSVGQ